MVEGDEAVGLGDTLGRGVRNVTLVPQATLSKATWALDFTTRDRPQTFSMVIGLRLCGMAELPF